MARSDAGPVAKHRHAVLWESSPGRRGMCESKTGDPPAAAHFPPVSDGTATAVLDSHRSSPRRDAQFPDRRAYNPQAGASVPRGRVRVASTASSSASAATTMPKISNVDSRPSGVTTIPASTAGSDSDE